MTDPAEKDAATEDLIAEIIEDALSEEYGTFISPDAPSVGGIAHAISAHVAAALAEADIGSLVDQRECIALAIEAYATTDERVALALSEAADIARRGCGAHPTKGTAMTLNWEDLTESLREELDLGGDAESLTATVREWMGDRG